MVIFAAEYKLCIPMKFIYYPVFISWYLVSLLPLRVLYFISDLLFYPLYYGLKYRRAVVRKNLTDSFPEKNDEEIVRIEKDFYHFFCDYVMETLKLFSMRKGEMMRRMTFSGLEEVRSSLRQEGRKYCFLYLGHYCNWEYVASLQYWLPDISCGQIYHPLYNKAFDRLFLRLREQFGGECIPMKSAMRRIVRMGGQGRPVMIGFIADQAPGWEAMEHWTPFLHRDTAFFQGVERIGRKVDAAVYYVKIERVRRGYYHASLERMAESAAALPEYKLTDSYAARLEEQICKHPAFWLWSHNRWKRTREEWLLRKGGEQ